MRWDVLNELIGVKTVSAETVNQIYYYQWQLRYELMHMGYQVQELANPDASKNTEIYNIRPTLNKIEANFDKLNLIVPTEAYKMQKTITTTFIYSDFLRWLNILDSIWYWIEVRK